MHDMIPTVNHGSIATTTHSDSDGFAAATIDTTLAKGY